MSTVNVVVVIRCHSKKDKMRSNETVLNTDLLEFDYSSETIPNMLNYR